MLIVQKFGGATLADAAKVRQVADRLAKQVQEGHKIVAVVSAMGSTTNELISLAQQVSKHPSLREMDMLLSVGERISMSLLSMALQDRGIKSTSLTGSQAGILTDESHSNAFIQDIRGQRVQEALQKNQVVVLAGFQGMSPSSKEITTLGRGGTDTTAIAMSAFLKADHCEILKDVPAIFSADPRLITEAKALKQLNYEELAEMTFWGAKVLHARSAQLALREKVKIYVGPAHSQNEGTWISEKETLMYEKPRVMSLNSFEEVLCLNGNFDSQNSALHAFSEVLEKNQIPAAQILNLSHNGEFELWITGPTEVLSALRSAVVSGGGVWKLDSTSWASVTATCAGAASIALSQKIFEVAARAEINARHAQWSSLSITLFVEKSKREKLLTALHSLVE